MRTIHEVEKSGNLYFLLNAAIGAINRLADQVGGGLQAVALALSTPDDNSGDVQKRLDELSQSLDQSTEELKAAVEAADTAAVTAAQPKT